MTYLLKQLNKTVSDLFICLTAQDVFFFFQNQYLNVFKLSHRVNFKSVYIAFKQDPMASPQCSMLTG